MYKHFSPTKLVAVFVFIISLAIPNAPNAQTPGTQKWRFGSGGDSYTSPAIGVDGTIYTGGLVFYGQQGVNALYALDPSGIKKWQFEFGGKLILSSPSIGLDGTIYISNASPAPCPPVCGYGHMLYALNTTGTKKWSKTFYGAGNINHTCLTPAIGEDGTIYVASLDYKLYALNPSNGTEKWEFVTGGAVTDPVIGADGTIYIGSDDKKLYAVNSDGTKKWDIMTGGFVNSPAIGADGTIYFWAGDNKLYAVESGGIKKWDFPVSGYAPEAIPAIGKDGTIYIAGDKLYAVSLGGAKKWEYSPAGLWTFTSPAIGADGTIYVGSMEAKLFAVNPDGSQKWEFSTDGHSKFPPTIGNDGILYINTFSGVNTIGSFYAIYSSSSGPANSSWPMYNHDAQHTGWVGPMSPEATNLSPVPDTGQTKCYNDLIYNGFVDIPCPQPGQPFYGQDANYTINPPSYTDLGDVIRDNITGLEWQKATAPGISDGKYTWQQAIDYCNNLSMGGKDDWRLPTIKELSTLVDSSRQYPGPTINTTYFPNTQSYWYWSSTTDASGPYAWHVSFSDGQVKTFYTSNYYHVRAVRGGQSSSSFIDNGDGTITDINSGLMWQQATAPGTYTWQQALAYCESLTLAGHSDWRLPNRNELQSLVDYGRYNPTINIDYFPDTGYGHYYYSGYWSATTSAYSSSSAWLIYFDYGDLDYFGKSNNCYVRAVRSGQGGQTLISLSSFTATPKAGKVDLAWSTESEIDNAGFNIYRAESKDGEYIKINDTLISSEGSSTGGASYEYSDKGVKNSKIYYYKLEDIDLSGESTMHGPVSATPRLIYRIGK